MHIIKDFLSLDVLLHDDYKVTFYGYRKALIAMPIVEIDLSKADNRTIDRSMRFIDKLIEMSNGHMDNHICFVIEYNGNSYALSYSDHKILIGAGVIQA